MLTKRQKLLAAVLFLLSISLGVAASLVTESYAQSVALINMIYLPIFAVLIVATVVGMIPLVKLSTTTVFTTSKDGEEILEDINKDDSLLALDTERGFELVNRDEGKVELETYPTLVHKWLDREVRVVKEFEQVSDNELTVEEYVNDDEESVSKLEIDESGDNTKLIDRTDYSGRIRFLSVIGLRYVILPKTKNLMSQRGYKLEDTSFDISL
ncbi:hypothetical protein GKQ38_01815 [Candidatus Nanohaloarchaea archaeon]|nr:hypothetical protein GKQ38_01815 [Candidatus Nanohaloarchaea archaeon]